MLEEKDINYLRTQIKLVEESRENFVNKIIQLQKEYESTFKECQDLKEILIYKKDSLLVEKQKLNNKTDDYNFNLEKKYLKITEEIISSVNKPMKIILKVAHFIITCLKYNHFQRRVIWTKIQ